MSPPPPAPCETELFMGYSAPGDSTYSFFETQRCPEAGTTCSDSLRKSNKTSTRGPHSGCCKTKSTYLGVLEGGGGGGDARPRLQMPSEWALILFSYEGHPQRVFSTLG